MCRALKVSASGYYAWCKRPECDRVRETHRLDVLIRAQFEASKKRDGSIKITESLRNKGEKVSRSKVARRMRNMGLRSKVKKKYRPTTDSNHSEPVAPNILNRQFTVSEPNRVWVSDITYLWTQSGWAYLTVILDLFSRMVVGWAVSTSLGHEPVLKALWRAVGRRRPHEGLLFHSDRGVQYACNNFRKAIGSFGFIQSMSRKGNCWDNAVAESFFRTLKTEWYYDNKLIDVHHAERELFEYIERYYNCHRLHATLGYVSPMQFEVQSLKKCA